MPIYEKGAVRINYQEAGSGVPLLVIPGDDTVSATLRALEDRFSGEVGVSVWNGIAVARFCARDGAALRRDLVMVLGALDLGTLPRLWSN